MTHLNFASSKTLTRLHIKLYLLIESTYLSKSEKKAIFLRYYLDNSEKSSTFARLLRNGIVVLFAKGRFFLFN